jgi:hypothetical protein
LAEWADRRVTATSLKARACDLRPSVKTDRPRETRAGPRQGSEVRGRGLVQGAAWAAVLEPDGLVGVTLRVGSTSGMLPMMPGPSPIGKPCALVSLALAGAVERQRFGFSAALRHSNCPSGL